MLNTPSLYWIKSKKDLHASAPTVVSVGVYLAEDIREWAVRLNTVVASLQDDIEKCPLDTTQADTAMVAWRRDSLQKSVELERITKDANSRAQVMQEQATRLNTYAEVVDRQNEEIRNLRAALGSMVTERDEWRTRATYTQEQLGVLRTANTDLLARWSEGYTAKLERMILDHIQKGA